MGFFSSIRNLFKGTESEADQAAKSAQAPADAQARHSEAQSPDETAPVTDEAASSDAPITGATLADASLAEATHAVAPSQETEAAPPAQPAGQESEADFSFDELSTAPELPVEPEPAAPAAAPAAAAPAATPAPAVSTPSAPAPAPAAPAIPPASAPAVSTPSAPAPAPAAPAIPPASAPAVSTPSAPASAPAPAASPAPTAPAPASPAPAAHASTPPAATQADQSADFTSKTPEEHAMSLVLRDAEPRLSVWLDIVLEGVDHADQLLWDRVTFLLRSLEAPANEITKFINAFRNWLEDMEYEDLDDFRSELQYRLALALDLEDEEDERSRLILKLSEGLAKTREHIARNLNSLFLAGRNIDEEFWEELEETLIMADVGFDTAHGLTERLRRRATAEGITDAGALREGMRLELLEVFKPVRRISVVNPPEVVLVIGVNGAGKTTTIAKLCHRAVLQGKKVLLVAGDTFRAAATEQLEIWAKRAGAGFYAKGHGADPAAVAYEAIDKAVLEHYQTVFVDTAGRLHTKINLMEELQKVARVLGKRHPGAPHRTILVLDATTGQNALSQVKLFNEACGIDELILTKLDGTAKGGIAVAVAMQYGIPISFVGLGEKMEDLRPFDAAAYVSALLGLDAEETA